VLWERRERAFPLPVSSYEFVKKRLDSFRTAPYIWGDEFEYTKSTASRVLLVALVGMLLFSAFASASEFSADVVTTHSEGVMTGKSMSRITCCEVS